MSLVSRMPSRLYSGLFIFLILLPLRAGELQAESIFSNPIYALDYQSDSILSADLNGDGRKDLAIAHGAGITVLPGLPHGQLGAQQALISTYGSIFAIATGDFNGDGVADLVQVTKYFPDGANIFLGSGGGRFGEALTTSIGGFQDDSIAVGDFNGDGWDDLAVGSSSVGMIWVALSRGDGSFDPASAVATGIYGYTLAVADFNADGYDDLVAADTLVGAPERPSQPGFVRLFPGLGNGTFGPAISTGVGIFPISIAVADLNGDGKRDLAVANYFSASVSILLGGGDGTFAPGVPVATVSAAAAVAAGDLDGDGTADLAIGAIDVLVARGRGDGTFEAPVQSASWGNATDLALGDFDGDSRPDVAALNTPTSIALLFSNGDGTLGAPANRVPIGGANPLNLNTADFNHDGIPDLAGDTAHSGTPTGVYVRLGLGNGEFDPDPRITPTLGAALLPGSVGDFNDDGEPDLVLIGAGATILLGKGDGTFDTGGTFSTGGAGQALAIADWDGDGILDLALSSTFPGNSFVTLKGAGNGTFGAPVTFPLDFAPSFRGMTLGDFDADGAMDLVIVPNTPPPPFNPSFPPPLANVYVVFGHGDGSFDAPAPFAAAVQPRTPVAADFNGDGIADLAVPDIYTVSGESASRGVAILLSLGDRSFAPVSWAFIYPAPAVLSAADFDGDGNQDLAVGKIGRGRVDISLLVGRGDGSFRPPLGFGGTFTIGNMVTADFNLDNRTDLAVSDNFDVPAVASILLNRLARPEHAPDAVPGGSQNGCGGTGGTPLDGSGSVDIDSTPGTNDDIVGFEWFEVIDALHAKFLGSGEQVSVSLSQGNPRVRLVVTDRLGETDVEELTLTPGVDSTPPDITVGLSPSVLSVPNHQLFPVHATVVAQDSCGDVTVTLESIESSEPDDTPGGSDGNTLGDIQEADYGADDFDFRLRAERLMPGPGRTYRITYRAVDASGNASLASATVLVPATPAQGRRLSSGSTVWSHPPPGGKPPRRTREFELR